MLKPAWDGESFAVSLASQILGRAIGCCVTELNTARGNLCARAGRRRQANGTRSAWEVSQSVGLIFMFLYPKPKEKERADPVRDKTLPTDSDGCHYDPMERGREGQARDIANQSTTCHPSRGVESLSNQGERDEEKMCSIPGLSLIHI